MNCVQIRPQYREDKWFKGHLTTMGSRQCRRWALSQPLPIAAGIQTEDLPIAAGIQTEENRWAARPPVRPALADRNFLLDGLLRS